MRYQVTTFSVTIGYTNTCIETVHSGNAHLYTCAAKTFYNYNALIFQFNRRSSPVYLNDAGRVMIIYDISINSFSQRFAIVSPVLMMTKLTIKVRNCPVIDIHLET